MIHVVRMKNVYCEFCRRQTEIICVWFDDEKARLEFVEHIKDTSPKKREKELRGEWFVFPGEAKLRCVGYNKHTGLITGTRLCPMSFKAPLNPDILRRLIESAHQEEAIPLVRDKAELARQERRA